MFVSGSHKMGGSGSGSQIWSDPVPVLKIWSDPVSVFNIWSDPEHVSKIFPDLAFNIRSDLDPVFKRR